MIQLGSGVEYDRSRELNRVDEERFDERVPVDDYGFYKYICAKHIEKTENIMSLRLFGCYGKYEDYEIKFISNAICKTLFNVPVTITNRNMVLSYLSVDDLCNIVEHFIKKDGRYRFYNATPDEAMSLLTIADKVKQNANDDKPTIVRNPGMNLEYTGNNARLKEEITGITFTPLTTGITKLYDWYVQNRQTLDKERIIYDRY